MLNRKERRAQRKLEKKQKLKANGLGNIEDLFTEATQNQQAGRLNEAAQCFQQILDIDPENVDALHFLGVINFQIGLPEAACRFILKAVAHRPTDAAIRNNLAIILNDSDRPAEAIEHFNKALEIKPSFPEALNNKGNALRKLGDLENARNCYERAVELAPQYGEAYNNLGSILLELDSLTLAETALQKSVELAPSNPAAWSNLGTTLKALGKFNEALLAIERSLKIDPNFSQAINNQGLVLLEIDKLDEAQQCFERAIQLTPVFADAHINLGLSLQMQGQPDAAVQTLKQGITANHENPDLHWNLALALLQSGNYEEGWQEYEWRWKLPKFSVFARDVEAQKWNGEKLASGSLFIHAEQGLGDTIQFSRYVPIAAKITKNVVFECPPALLPLFRSAIGWETISVVAKPPSSCSAQISLMSLPGVLGTTLDNIPCKTPYLSIRSRQNTELLRTMQNFKGLKVGLVWAGSKEYQNDSRRSIPFEVFSGLMKAPHCTFFSLQIEGQGAAESPIKDGTLIDLSTQFNDFSDTADALSQLDLVISVDTSVAHLAGALGIPVWVLLPKASDWRWLLHRSDSPWYSSVRLFRQKEFSIWAPVIKDITAELTSLSSLPNPNTSS